MYTVTVTKYMFWRKTYNNKKFLHAAKHVPQISKELQVVGAARVAQLVM
jgi:hypothetical protein